MNKTILHTVQITDKRGFLDSIPAPTKPAALTLARQIYQHREARLNGWTCFYATYTKSGTYSHLDGYELIPQP